jgi:hypothetical protein
VYANGHTTLNAPGLVGSPKSKQRRVSLVPGWVTAWEYEMLLAYFYCLFFGLVLAGDWPFMRAGRSGVGPAWLRLVEPYSRSVGRQRAETIRGKCTEAETGEWLFMRAERSGAERGRDEVNWSLEPYPR